MKIDTVNNKFKLSHRDINSIAYTEYFRQTGIKWMLGIIVVALLAQVGRVWLPVLPLIVVYSVMGILCVWFLVIYTKGQNKHRKKLWEQLHAAGLTDDSGEE